MPRDRRLYMTFPNDFWTHPKVARLSDSAFRVFVEANGHSRMRETDGVIEREDAEFMWPEAALEELVNSHPTRPLMVRDGDRYVLRDYAEHQLTKADREELSKKRSDAGRVSAAKRQAKREQVLNTSEQVLNMSQQTATEREIERETERVSSTKKQPTRSRGTRVPRDFTITADMRAWAAKETPNVDVDKKLGEWIDYWTGVAGAKGVKSDWVSTWRNGMRKQEEFALRDLARNPQQTRKRHQFNGDDQ